MIKMKNMINEMWIIRGTGEMIIHVKHKNYNINTKESEDQLLSGLLSAINYITTNKLNTIVMGKSKLILYRAEDYFIVSKVDIKTNEKKILEMNKEFHDLFKKYEKDQWNGAIWKYEHYYQEIKKFSFTKATESKEMCLNH